MKIRRILSIIVDVILVALIGIFTYTQIAMAISRRDPKNYGVPKAFGSSILYVLTDSMADGDGSLVPGTGILIKEVDEYTSLKKCTPIYDEEKKLIDYEKDGDIVTFYYERYGVPDTHRVIDIDTENGKIKTMGDNPALHKLFQESGGATGYEQWDKQYLIGKVTFASLALGQFLVISSPSIAASAGKNSWLFPILMVAPIVLIAISYIIESIIKYRKESKEREAIISANLEKSGIDLNDEEAVEYFKMKEEFRLDMEEEKEKLKEKIRKDIAKEKKKNEKK